MDGAAGVGMKRFLFYGSLRGGRDFGRAGFGDYDWCGRFGREIFRRIVAGGETVRDGGGCVAGSGLRGLSHVSRRVDRDGGIGGGLRGVGHVSRSVDRDGGDGGGLRGLSHVTGRVDRGDSDGDLGGRLVGGGVGGDRGRRGDVFGRSGRRDGSVVGNDGHVTGDDLRVDGTDGDRRWRGVFVADQVRGGGYDVGGR